MGERVKLPPGRTSEDIDESGLAELRDIGDGRNQARAKLPRCDRPYTPQSLDRQRVEERELVSDRDDQQAVGLCDAARDLSQKLRPRHAHGDGNPDPLVDLLSQASGNLRRCAGDPPKTADVEERLVDREPFYERRRIAEDVEHRRAGLRVGLHAWPHDDRVGAQAASLGLAHRRPHAEGLGFVAGGEHDPAAHDHREAAERRVVTLLDGGVERVGVRVQDRAFVGHSLMMTAITDTGRGRGGKARGQHLREAGAADLRERQPTGARRPALPGATRPVSDRIS